MALASAGGLLLATVGPVTAEPLQVAGFDVVVPERWRMGALVRLVIMELGSRAGHRDRRRHCCRSGPGPRPSTTASSRCRPSGFAVLRRLARAPGEVVSREELLRVLPGDSCDPHAAEVAVGRLRDAVGATGVIRTVVKRGYALNPVALESTG